MAKVIYNGQSYECGEQSVLECLLAQNIPVPFSCRAGLCQGCMMRAISGKVPEKAKAWLSDNLVAQNHFLPCVCYPEEDMEVMLPNMEELFEHMLSGRIDMNHP